MFPTPKALLETLSWPADALDCKGTWSVSREEEVPGNPLNVRVHQATILVSPSQVILRARRGDLEGGMEPQFEAVWDIQEGIPPVLRQWRRMGLVVEPLDEVQALTEFRDRVLAINRPPQFQVMGLRQKSAPSQSPGR